MMKRVLTPALACAVLASCTDGPTGTEYGGVAFEVYTVRAIPSGSPTLVAAATAADRRGTGFDDLFELLTPEMQAAVQEAQPLLEDIRPPQRAIAIDSARILLSGPENRRILAVPGETVTIETLPIGTYTAVLEGWSGDDLVYSGTVTDIDVTGGQRSTVAQVLFAPTRLDFRSIGQTVELRSPTGTAWLSSDETVASIGSDGVLRAESNGAVDVTGRLATSRVGISVRVAQAVSSVTVSPSSATIDAGTTQQFTATAFDSLGTEITGAGTVLWLSSDHRVATIDQSGLATGTGGGTVTIAGAVMGEPGVAALSVNALAATQLAFTVEPEPVSTGDGAFRALEVEIRDANGDRVTSARDLVTIEIVEELEKGARLLGSRTVAAVDGVATFSGLSLDKGGAGLRFAATSGGLSADTTSAFSVGNVAVFGDTLYVDYDRSRSEAEASGLEDAWDSFDGFSARSFSGSTVDDFAGALEGAKVLAIPELERVGLLVDSLSAEAKDSIVSFVDNGGTLVINYDFSDRYASLLNDLFGYTLASGTVTGEIQLFASFGTPFAGGPATLPSNNATGSVSSASLPGGSQVVYRAATSTDAVVALITQGTGQIVILGWDWFNPAPTGVQDGGWLEVLRRSGLF